MRKAPDCGYVLAAAGAGLYFPCVCVCTAMMRHIHNRGWVGNTAWKAAGAGITSFNVCVSVLLEHADDLLYRTAVRRAVKLLALA